MRRKAAPNAHRFDTTQFEFSHGKAPRGAGRWHFTFVYCDGTEVLFIATGPYSWAKRDVVRQSRARFGMRAWHKIAVGS